MSKPSTLVEATPEQMMYLVRQYRREIARKREEIGKLRDQVARLERDLHQAREGASA